MAIDWFNTDDDLWHMVTVSYDSTTRAKRIFVDGRLRAEATNPAAMVEPVSVQYFCVGANETPTSFPLVGSAAEASVWNRALSEAVRAGLQAAGLPEDAVQFVGVQDHEAVTELVRAVGLVDIAIPRGGERLIRAMCEAALVPVLKHYKGVCHVYVDDEADLGMALTILDNAKTQRTGVCNAAECLLVHRRLAPLFMPMVEAWANDKGVTLHENEAGTEYLSLDINVAVVDDCRAAIEFINAHSSHHSDCIVTNDADRAKEFLRDVDSACVYHNVSTRFTDGAEFGMGAEIGISTDKLHARGPMGLEELTTYKYTVTGDGVVRN